MPPLPHPLHPGFDDGSLYGVSTFYEFVADHYYLLEKQSAGAAARAASAPPSGPLSQQPPADYLVFLRPFPWAYSPNISSLLAAADDWCEFQPLSLYFNERLPRPHLWSHDAMFRYERYNPRTLQPDCFVDEPADIFVREYVNKYVSTQLWFSSVSGPLPRSL
jgi:hypothetical protein